MSDVPTADAALAAKVNAYMAEKPRATRNDLRHACNTSQPKLEKLEQLGLIQLPRKLSPSEIGRKAGRPGWAGFRLPGSPTR